MANFADYLLALIILPFIARTLGPEQLGYVGLAQTFGIFILEAICCGSPVIATNGGGVKELIDDVKIKLGDEEKETFDHWVRIVEPDAHSITKEIIDLDNTKRSKEDYILTIQKIRREFVWEKRLEHYEKLIRENFKHAVQ